MSDTPLPSLLDWSGPHGVLALRLEADSHRVNAHGRVQAGWLIARMEQAAVLIAERLTLGGVTTVAINTCQFNTPLFRGDVLSLYVERLRVGQHSLTLKVSANVHRLHEVLPVTELVLTLVAIDEHGHSRLIPPPQA